MHCFACLSHAICISFVSPWRRDKNLALRKNTRVIDGIGRSVGSLSPLRSITHYAIWRFPLKALLRLAWVRITLPAHRQYAISVEAISLKERVAAMTHSPMPLAMHWVTAWGFAERQQCARRNSVCDKQ